MLCSLSNLKEQDLEQIRALESELGRPLLAFSCHEAKPAVLDDEALKKIQETEKKIGFSLVALEAWPS